MIVKKLSKLTLREKQGLAETLDGYGDFFEHEINENICELWEINNGESFAITRLENDEFKNIKILVLCCYKGKNLNDFANLLAETADKNNWFVRFHTKSPALARWMNRKYDCEPLEHVLMREPKHG